MTDQTDELAPRGQQAVHKIVVPAAVADGRPARIRRRAPARGRAGRSPADVHVRGNEITVTGAARRGRARRAARSTSCSPCCAPASHSRRTPSSASWPCCAAETAERPADVLTLNILSNRGRTIRPKTLNQKRYVDAIDEHTIVFGIGPAGTGKTYLAMAKAVQALQAKQVNRIILTRPAVEAGERLGLPAGHAVREDRPLPAAAVRRAARHDRPRLDPAADGRRHDRGRARWRTCAGVRSRSTRRSSRRTGSGRSASSGSATSSSARTAGRRRCSASTRRVASTSTASPTQDGASTLCCGEHLWSSRTPRRPAARAGRAASSRPRT